MWEGQLLAENDPGLEATESLSIVPYAHSYKAWDPAFTQSLCFIRYNILTGGDVDHGDNQSYLCQSK
jgi:hypothetical protein